MNEKMKICLIGPTLPFRGGISHYTTLLFRHLKKKHDVIFIAFARQYPGWLFPGKTDIDPSKKNIQEDGSEPILDSLNPVTWIRSVGRIVREKPDLVIIPWWVSFWAPQFWTISFLLKRVLPIRILFLCHNVVEHESGILDQMLTRMVLNQGDLFIVHSTDDEQNLKRIKPKAVVKKTFHPTYKVFNMADFEPDKVRNRFGITGNILLFFGFVREYKGLKFLIKAMAKIVERHDATLLIVGEFWNDKDYYLSLIRDLGLEKQIIIVDEYVPNEEVGDYFSACDIVVQPYVSGTGSGVVQTAFGFNKPVIASRVGCLPDVIDHGRTGYLIRPGSPEAILNAVDAFLKIQNKSIFSENIRQSLHRFSWEKMLDTIDELTLNPLTAKQDRSR